MDATVQITNCPFCSGEGRIRFTAPAHHQMVCTGCHASGPVCEGVLEAVHAWNKRGGLGNTRVALHDAAIPTATFKLIERIREMTDRLERGDLGSPTVGLALLLDEEKRHMTLHGLRISKLQSEPLVRAAFDAIQAGKQVGLA